LLPADEADTKVDNQTPIELVLHDLAKLTLKVDALTKLVETALDARISDDQAFRNSREALRRCDVVDDRCLRNHPHQTHPTNGADHG